MNKAEDPPLSRVNFIYFLLLAIAFVVIQTLIGGTRLLFSFPSYLFLGSAAILTVVSFRRPTPAPSRVALLSGALLGGYVLLRAWHSPYPYLARDDLFMAAACLIVYLMTALHLTGSKERMKLVVVLLVIAAGQVALGLYQFITQEGFMLFGFLRPDAMIREGMITRASGMFISPNHFAGFLEAIAMFALAIAFWSRWPIAEKLTTGLVAVLCYIGVAISLSRGGYLSSAFSLLALTALSLWLLARLKPGRAFLPALVVLIGVGALFGTAVSIGAKNDRIRLRAQKVIAKDIRFANWAATIDQFKTAPWFGTGAGTHLIYGRLYRRPELQSDPVHAHGDYLEMLAEYGITGEALALLFLGSHLASGFGALGRLTERQKGVPNTSPLSNTLGLTLGALGVTAALMAHSVVDFNMHIPGNALLYAFAFGILANPGDRPQPRMRPAADLSVALGHAVLPVIGFCLIMAIAPRLKGERLSEQARVALRERKFNDVIRLAKEAALAEPVNPDPWFYLGEAHRMRASTMPVPNLRKNFFEEAVDAYRQGLRLLPEDINLLVRCGQALDGLGRHDEAEQAYRKAILWDPNLAILYGYYGNHLVLSGKKEEAEAIFLKARKLGGLPATKAGQMESRKIAETSPQKRTDDVGGLPQIAPEAESRQPF